MAKERIQKLREKGKEELEKEFTKEKQNLQELKFDLARGKVKNSAAVRDSKKRIARLLTLIGEGAKETKNSNQNG